MEFPERIPGPLGIVQEALDRIGQQLQPRPPRRCDHCQFWERATNVGRPMDYGDCRVRSPRMGDKQSGSWPVTQAHQWCGRFRPVRDPLVATAPKSEG